MYTSYPDKLREGDLYKLFLTTNEKNSLETVCALSAAPLSGNAALVTSALFGLDLVSVRNFQERKIETVFLADISKATHLFWKVLQEETLLRWRTKEDILGDLESRLLAREKDFYYTENSCKPRCFLKLLQKSVDEGTSFLADQERIDLISDLFLRRQAHALAIDLTDALHLKQLSLEMRWYGCRLDMTYISNILEYADKQRKRESFLSALEQLKQVCSNEMYLIDTHPRKHGIDIDLCSSDPLFQRVRQGFYSSNLEQFFEKKRGL